MNKILTIILIFVAKFSFGQGANLQFNQVINLSNGSHYIVPPGKVLKIESIYTDYTGLAIRIPLAGCSISPTPWQSKCLYSNGNGLLAPNIMFKIGDIDVKSSISYNYFSGDTLFTPIGGLTTCADCSGYFEYNLSPNSAPATPIWLSPGKEIVIMPLSNSVSTSSFPARSNGTQISAIEFNVIP
jgi:hypothetical protein